MYNPKTLEVQAGLREQTGGPGGRKGGILSSGPELGQEVGDGAGGEGGSIRAPMPMLRRLGFVLEVWGLWLSRMWPGRMYERARGNLGEGWLQVGRLEPKPRGK